MDEMTISECINVYENSRLQTEYYTPDAVTAAYIAGLAALREKEERENPAPLTPEEIQQMRGMPVWCEELSCYGIIKIERAGTWANKPFLVGFWLRDKDAECGTDFECDIKRRGLTLYRHRPPEKGAGNE